MIEDVVMDNSRFVGDFPEAIGSKAASLAHRFMVTKVEHAAINERLAHSAFTLASWATTLSRIK